MFFLADPILVGGLSLLKPALRLMTSYRLPAGIQEAPSGLHGQTVQVLSPLPPSVRMFSRSDSKAKLCTFR
jgi:hypothetical protein